MEKKNEVRLFANFQCPSGPVQPSFGGVWIGKVKRKTYRVTDFHEPEATKKIKLKKI